MKKYVHFLLAFLLASTPRYRTRADNTACGLVDQSTKQYTELYTDDVRV